MKLKHVSATVGVTANIYMSVTLSRGILKRFLVVTVSIAQCRDTAEVCEGYAASRYTDWRSGQDKVSNNAKQVSKQYVIAPLRILSCTHAF